MKYLIVIAPYFVIVFLLWPSNQITKQTQRKITSVVSLDSTPKSECKTTEKIKVVEKKIYKEIPREAEKKLNYEMIGLTTTIIETFFSQAKQEATMKFVENATFKKDSLTKEDYSNEIDCGDHNIDGPCEVSRLEYENEDGSTTLFVEIDGQLVTKHKIHREEGTSVTQMFHPNGQMRTLSRRSPGDSVYYAFDENGRLKGIDGEHSGFYIHAVFNEGEFTKGYASATKSHEDYEKFKNKEVKLPKIF